MAYALPNGSTFDIASAYGPAVVVTAISNAAPAVVSATAHGLTNGTIVLLSGGWSKINNRTYRVSAATADSFALEGTDTTDTVRYPAGVGATTTIRPVTTWTQVPQIMSVDFSGGEQNFFTFQFLEDDDERQFPTNKSAITVSMSVADDPGQPFVPVVEGYDEDKSTNVARLNLSNDSVILYPAVVSITATPSLTVNELMTRDITLALQARPTRYQ